MRVCLDPTTVDWLVDAPCTGYSGVLVGLRRRGRAHGGVGRRVMMFGRWGGMRFRLEIRYGCFGRRVVEHFWV